MDAKDVRTVWERAARRAAEARGRKEPPPRALLPDGGPTFMEAPFAASADDLVGADAAILGIPYDPASQLMAPSAIRRESAALSLRRGPALIPGGGRRPVVLDRIHLVDHGDVAADQRDVEASFVAAHEKLAGILAAGAVPIVLGGDHAVSIAVLQVLAGKLSGKLGVVVLDARFDLSFEPRYGAGSQWARAFELGIVRPANFVQIGIRGLCEASGDEYVIDELGSTYYTVDDVDELGIAAVTQEALEAAAAGTEAIYLSLDLGVVDKASGGQAWPDPVGLSARELLRSLRILSTGRLAAFDVCGLQPARDPEGQLGRLAARAVVEVIAGLALQRP